MNFDGFPELLSSMGIAVVRQESAQEYYDTFGAPIDNDGRPTLVTAKLTGLVFQGAKPAGDTPQQGWGLYEPEIYMVDAKRVGYMLGTLAHVMEDYDEAELRIVEQARDWAHAQYAAMPDTDGEGCGQPECGGCAAKTQQEKLRLIRERFPHIADAMEKIMDMIREAKAEGDAEQAGDDYPADDADPAADRDTADTQEDEGSAGFLLAAMDEDGTLHKIGPEDAVLRSDGVPNGPQDAALSVPLLPEVAALLKQENNGERHFGGRRPGETYGERTPAPDAPEFSSGSADYKAEPGE